MGQYFSPTIEINEDVKYKIEINGPAKFMEWSYLFDATMMALVHHVAKITSVGTIKFTQCGDYSELHDGYNWQSNDTINADVEAVAKQIESLYDDEWLKDKEEALSYTL